MYRLSLTEDLAFFAGTELQQVCIGANEAILNFDAGVRITILGDFSVAVCGARALRFDDPRRGAQVLIGLIGDSVAAAEATQSGDLRVRFTSGSELIALDSSTQFESFWIKGPEREIIV